MRLASCLLPRTIMAQITWLVIVAVLLGMTLSTVVVVRFYEAKLSTNPEMVIATRAARVATIVRQARAMETGEGMDQSLDLSRWMGMRTERLAINALVPALEKRDPISQRVAKELHDMWKITTLEKVTSPHDPDALLVAAGDDSVLAFSAGHTSAPALALIPLAFAVATIALVLLFSAIYGVRWITAPLLSVAEAARSFGRHPEDDSRLAESGPREIAQVAVALNDMRRRVRSLMDERTRMLAAISHDLRTPLTRLRLRAERLNDDKAARAILRDVSAISGMLSETLAYLRESGRSEEPVLTDLPSLLQTVCGEFADIGHDVSYQGPARLPLYCRTGALTRAVSNIVDNATKHGRHVTVTLKAGEEVEIAVADDGPGIAEALRDKVFDPFFKVDAARGSSGGFGLGLSIARDLVRAMDGEIILGDQHPQGLRAAIRLPPGRPGGNIS